MRPFGPDPSYPPALTMRQVDDADQLRDGWVGGPRPSSDPVRVVDPDPAWPQVFAEEVERLRALLGDVAVRIEHIGSTSVPDLPAKPIIDVDVEVADTTDEAAYVPALERVGYRLVLREPWWNGHRMLLGINGGSHVHVFPVGAPEVLRHLLFRDWLRTHPEDRALYARAKRELAQTTATAPGDYTLAKNGVIDDIYGRIFSVPPESHPAWPRT